jgi:Holliday junction resolvasome RuvABC endonuclease subunit
VTDIPDYKQRRAEELMQSVRTMADLKTAIMQGIRKVHAEREVTTPILLTTLAEMLALAAVEHGVPFENYIDQTKQAYGLAIAHQKLADEVNND